MRANIALLLAGGLTVSLLPAATVATPNPTFSKDIAPIFNARCVECHRAGELAPMSLTNYEDARPWAKAIRENVVRRVMPPWLADPAHGEFRNDRRLPQPEIDTIVSWVNAGAPEGDRKDLPAAPHFEQGWNIGKPDAVFEMSAGYAVPAQGVVPYKYFRVPTNFTEDRWIQAAEARPGNRKGVHHIVIFLEEAGKPVDFAEATSFFTGYAPGSRPTQLEPGVAKLVKAGSTLVFQMHYTPTGTAFTDRSYVGVKFATAPPQRMAVTDKALNFAFRIPANDPNYEVKSTWTATKEVSLEALLPHMHLRGKDFQYTVTFPDGRQQVLLLVPRYDFNWQLGYALKEPLTLPKGTRIDCVAHYDNSANNPGNPDPTKEVRWGDQTFQEMMVGFLTYTVPVEHAALARK